MTDIILKKIGYYSIIKTKKNKIKVDSGEFLFISRFNKTIKNPYRDIKYFKTVDDAEIYIKKVLKKKNKKKYNQLKKAPKSLYLV